MLSMLQMGRRNILMMYVHVVISLPNMSIASLFQIINVLVQALLQFVAITKSTGLSTNSISPGRPISTGSPSGRGSSNVLSPFL